MIRRTLHHIVLAASLFGASLSGCTLDRSPISNGGGFDAGPRAYMACPGDGLVDILSDEDNCGSCGTTCDPYASCIGGVCTLPEMDAGSACDVSRLELDRYNCGSCGNVCLPIQDCRDGECLYAGYAEEDNVCMNQTDCAKGFTCETPEDWEISYCMDPSKRPCEFDDDCAGENELCLIGYCTLVLPEDCDGIDNDRDGERDEGLTMGTCYTGPAGTEGVGSCRAGTQLCVDGEWSVCVGDILPVAEVGIFACDGVDNDCDGCADNRYDPMTGECITPEPLLFDIVMIVDKSSSMIYTIAAAQEAMYRISAPFAVDLRYYFSLATVPYPVTPGTTTTLDGIVYPGDPDDAVETPLSPFPVFASALSSIRLSGFGDEQSYDITYLAASERLPSLRFRPGATRIFMVFTDEPGQSYAMPQLDASEVCAPFDARPDDVLAVVTTSPSPSGWPCADITRSLSDDPSVVAQDILDILGYVCEK